MEDFKAGDVVEVWDTTAQQWVRATLHLPSMRGWYVIYPPGSYVSSGWAFQIRRPAINQVGCAAS